MITHDHTLPSFHVEILSWAFKKIAAIHDPTENILIQAQSLDTDFTQLKIVKRSIMATRKFRNAQGDSNVWQFVPTEIRPQILKNITDLPTVQSLLVASPHDQIIHRQYKQEIWGPLVK